MPKPRVSGEDWFYLQNFRDTPEQVQACLTCKVPACACTGTCRSGVSKDNSLQELWDQMYELYESGLSDAEIGEIVGKPEDYVTRWRRRRLLRALPQNLKSRGRKRNWSVDDAMRLYLSGASDKAIGEALGCSGASIQEWRKKNGLRRQNKREK